MELRSWLALSLAHSSNGNMEHFTPVVFDPTTDKIHKEMANATHRPGYSAINEQEN